MDIEEFLKIKQSTFQRKISSIPENEPLYKVLQSRTINLGKIKDKEERKYWRNLKRANKIPDEYLSTQELDELLKENLGIGKVIK